MAMNANMGTIDRVLRGVVGLAILSLAFIGPQTPWGYVGLIPLATAIFSFCPAYRLLGISSCSR
jgi:hypothetical protein